MEIVSYLCVLLACLTCVRSVIVLTQPESVVKKPGESHKLSCTVSGFDINSYYMDWVKQVPGKGLEWLVSYANPSSTDYYAPGVQNRFTASKDSKTFYLQMTNLRAEDTAIYYCARDTCDYLDYWGKGTLLTVTSDVQSAPSVYIANPYCGTSSDQDEISLLCLVKDFRPESISQIWSTDSGDISTGIKKYPAALGQNMKYTMSVVLKVSASDWKTKSFYACKAGFKPDEMVEAQIIPKKPEPKPQAPKLISLVPSLEVVYNQTTAVLGCVISEFYPDAVKVSWRKAGVQQEAVVLPSNTRKDGDFETVTFLTVPTVEWTERDVYTCEVTHAPSNFNGRISMWYRGGMSVFIRNPSIEEVWINNTATLVCEVVCADPSQVQISWEVNGKERSEGIVTQGPREEGSQRTVVSRLRTSAMEWASGVEYVCSAQGPSSSSPVSKRTRSAKVEPKSPTVRLLPPPAQETKSKNTATLECMITGFYPDLIHVSWEKDGSPISSNTSAAPTALEQARTFSARHYLTVSTEEWKKGSVFTCTVSHPPTNSTTSQEVKDVQDQCLDTGISVTLSKPSFEEIWRNRTATIICEVLHGDLEGVRVTWQVDGKEREDGVKTQGPERNGDKERISSRLTVPAAEWESGVEYLCLVEDESLPTPEKRAIKKMQVDAQTRPQVYILPPSPDEMETDQTATLVCLVTRFSPAEIYVAWMANDTLLKSGFVNQPVTEDGGRGWNSAGSRLTVPAEEWNSSTTFSCVVGHESLTTNLFRSINKSHSKPTLVNISLVLADSLKSCF
ncbi:immunoglobulin gamma-1 heavy chain-like [Heptranchias perlo]|uniref:immunoglobulin gamma-1 heavy chain-like n=1 Tax=Heptranchias perlo TaxID=212740 RepID=UPI003559F2FD